MTTRTLLLALGTMIAAAASPAIVTAQNAEREVAAVVERLFDGMRNRDSAVVRSVFHPEARLQTAAARDGVPQLRSVTVDAFVAEVGGPDPGVWDERIWDLEIRVDDRLATAWMRYAFFLGDRFSHCGVNAFQLFRGTEGWQVTQITDTRQREGCPEPPA